MKKKIDLTEYSLSFQNLPASFDGCRIGFLSDLHDWEIGLANEYLLEVMEGQSFDYFFCGGDMIVGSDRGIFSYENLLRFFEKLGGLVPVYYSYGNHEERMRFVSGTGKINELEAFRKLLEERGVRVLDNDSTLLLRNGQAICLKGLSLGMDYYRRWWNRKPLHREELDMMIGDKKDFTILLAHNPIFFKAYDLYGAELVLSGHVHGGLMVIPALGGVISPELQLFPKYDFGLFNGNQTKMIVSRGLGAHTLPIRIHNRPELVAVTLKRTCEFRAQLVE